MWMRPDDEMGTPVCYFLGEGALLFVFVELVLKPPVHNDDDKVGVLLSGFDEVLLYLLFVDEVNNGGGFGGYSVGIVGIVEPSDANIVVGSDEGVGIVFLLGVGKGACLLESELLEVLDGMYYAGCFGIVGVIVGGN